MYNMADKLEGTEKEQQRKIIQKINGVSSRWDVDYPFDPRLQYIYPAPTVTILTNIANAMAAVPRFYVQVLHLMNRMNLPAPFGMPTLTPPVPVGVKPPPPPEREKPPEPDVLSEEEMDFSSTEESEIESEGDEAVKRTTETEAVKRTKRRERPHSRRKKLRLQIQMQAQMQAIAGIMPKQTGSGQQLADVFEQPQQAAVKKIAFKIADDAALQDGTAAAEKTGEDDVEPSVETSHVVVGSFGKIEPQQVSKPESDDEDDEDWATRAFISSRRLQRGRLSEREMKELDVFKNYDPGEPTSRLYVKNLARKVTEKDLQYIYGRYVDLNNDLEKTMFYVQLLTGRMKGQAFVTLPNDVRAKEALRDTNGFQLHGKAMVVQYARSAKPKDK